MRVMDADEPEGYTDLNNDGLLQAALDGLIVVEPGPDDVFVDLDTDEARAAFAGRLDMFNRLVLSQMPPATATFTVSKSGNSHAYVKLPAPITGSPEEIATRRVLYQALLGSDLNREILGLGRALRSMHPSTTFFEVPRNPDADLAMLTQQSAP